MKNIPVAMRESLDKMKGSMLLSMAKGMTAHDAETMARHWGYISPTQIKIEPVIKERPMTIPRETIVPDRSVLNVFNTPMETVLEETNVPSPVPSFLANVPLETVTEVHVKLPVDLSKAITNEINVDDLDHPIFGKKVASLGYKTVYLTSVSSLAKTQVWERQRTLRPDRAARIAASKIALGRTSSLSGVITMFSDKLSGRSGIVDGQHRAGALMILSQEGYWEGLDQNILIDVFETESDEQVVALFKEINSAEPVRLVDMPGEVCI